jgi:hypothetical protein
MQLGVLAVASMFVTSLALGQQSNQDGQTAGDAVLSPVFKGLLYDSHGKLIGRLLEIGTVVRAVKGTFVSIRVVPTGFFEFFPAYAFQSRDCTGTQYLNAGWLPVEGRVATIPPGFPNPTLFFPGKPTALTMASWQFAGGPCQQFNPPRHDSWGIVNYVDVDSWGFVPPFHVQ